jgi:hypothetical protein
MADLDLEALEEIMKVRLPSSHLFNFIARGKACKARRLFDSVAIIGQKEWRWGQEAVKVQKW